MFVYYLSNNKTPNIPFYIGITKNISNRFKQHKRQWQKHKPYITNKNEFQIHTIYDTGTNKLSKILAENIETNLIRQYNTVNHGSNKIYTTQNYFKKIWDKNHYKKTYNRLFNETMYQKRRETRKRKTDKKFKKIIKLIKEDPLSWNINTIIKNSQFKNINQLNNYTNKNYNQTFVEWLEEYKHTWLIKHNLI